MAWLGRLAGASSAADCRVGLRAGVLRRKFREGEAVRGSSRRRTASRRPSFVMHRYTDKLPVYTLAIPSPSAEWGELCGCGPTSTFRISLKGVIAHQFVCMFMQRFRGVALDTQASQDPPSMSLHTRRGNEGCGGVPRRSSKAASPAPSVAWLPLSPRRVRSCAAGHGPSQPTCRRRRRCRTARPGSGDRA
jgi:hypothetical protein